jgi:hypothetical protein
MASALAPDPAEAVDRNAPQESPSKRAGMVADCVLVHAAEIPRVVPKFLQFPREELKELWELARNFRQAVLVGRLIRTLPFQTTVER